ncbi:MAG: hypothetical protein IJG37_06425 [Synergistaceae bacterium]|nr:hypothetical protein [Synergistaceae bacterium]MBQ6971307.1 hypothetical protein [Synergistaceae bacterium]
MYTRKMRVLPSCASSSGRIKLRSLLDMFQDTASLAVEDIEGTATELFSRGYAWILSRYEISFHGEMPCLDDDFDLATYHDPNHGYNTLRMFETSFVSAKTSWLLVDVRSGRPVKPLAHIPGIASRDTADIPPGFRGIPGIKDVTHRAEIPVMPHDLDYNGHVNNAVYFAWVADNLPRGFEPAFMCAEFRSGARTGETVALEYGREDGDILCRVMRPGLAKPGASFLISQEAGA